MLVCYFTNVYPAPSHTTMRREIIALEALGVGVIRVAARPFRGELVDPTDVAEAKNTSYTTESLVRAATCLTRVALTRPLHLFKALGDVIRIGTQTKSGIWKNLMYLGQACVLLQLANKCAHIHVNFGNATSIAIYCRILGGPPVSLRIHGPEEFIDSTPSDWAWKIRHAAFLAPITEFGMKKVQSCVSPGRHPKIKLLRCGIEVALLTRGCDAAMRLPSELNLVCIARLESRKGHDVLLKALHRLKQDGLTVKLTIIGDGSCRASLKKQARELSLSESIHFAGWQAGPEVILSMRNARVVVLPSFSEGLPIVLMEALAIGRAVVTTRVDGIPELIFPGKTGWLVEAGDVSGLADALKSALLTSDEDLLVLGRAGRSLVARQHEVGSIMKEFVALIEASQDPL
ncbi:MAG: hypothetical protein RIR09_2934 [Pseudomonadota bacterium]|jgi:glycosyltransferase involved in cell wall biosynthesis